MIFFVKISSWFRLVWRSEHCRGGSKAPGARCSLRSVNEDQRDRCQAINLDIQHTVQICTGTLAHWQGIYSYLIEDKIHATSMVYV